LGRENVERFNTCRWECQKRMTRRSEDQGAWTYSTHLFNAVGQWRIELSGPRGAQVLSMAISDALLDPWQPIRALVFSVQQIHILFPHGA